MEVIRIKIVYYPDYDEKNNVNRLKRSIEYDLKRQDNVLWKKVIHMLRLYTTMTKEDFVQEIQKNQKLSDKKKKIKLISRGKMKILEFRIPPVRPQGVYRIYFQYNEDYIFILDAERKNDDAKRIDTAYERYKELKVKTGGVL
jgi:putative component of toxin-antitoxin plasmid stabilization module